MKCVLTADDIWNIGFDHYFDRNVKILESMSEGAKLYFSKGFNDAKVYKEALGKKGFRSLDG